MFTLEMASYNNKHAPCLYFACHDNRILWYNQPYHEFIRRPWYIKRWESGSHRCPSGLNIREILFQKQHDLEIGIHKWPSMRWALSILCWIWNQSRENCEPIFPIAEILQSSNQYYFQGWNVVCSCEDSFYCAWPLGMQNCDCQ